MLWSGHFWIKKSTKWRRFYRILISLLGFQLLQLKLLVFHERWFDQPSIIGLYVQENASFWRKKNGKNSNFIFLAISRISREKWGQISRISREIQNARNVPVYPQYSMSCLILANSSTVWKFQDYSITQILREMNFGDFKMLWGNFRIFLCLSHFTWNQFWRA